MTDMQAVKDAVSPLANFHAQVYKLRRSSPRAWKTSVDADLNGFDELCKSECEDVIKFAEKFFLQTFGDAVQDTRRPEELDTTVSEFDTALVCSETSTSIGLAVFASKNLCVWYDSLIKSLSEFVAKGDAQC